MTDLRVGGICGFRYLSIGELVTESLDDDANVIWGIYKFYYLSKNKASDYYIAEQQHDNFSRHFMLPKQNNEALYTSLNRMIESEDFMKNWNKMLLSYTMPIR